MLSAFEVQDGLGSLLRISASELRPGAARDVLCGINLAVFSPHAFAEDSPCSEDSWSSLAVRDGVEFSTASFLGKSLSYFFPRTDFEVSGNLPAPAL